MLTTNIILHMEYELESVKDLSRFPSTVAKLLHIMTEIQKQEVEFPVYHLMERGISHNVAAPYFKFRYIHCSSIYRRLYNPVDVLGCRTVALPNTE